LVCASNYGKGGVGRLIQAVFPTGQAGLWAGKKARPGRTEHGLGQPRLEIYCPAKPTKPAGRPIGLREYIIPDIFCIVWPSLLAKLFCIKNIIVQYYWNARVGYGSSALHPGGSYSNIPNRAFHLIATRLGGYAWSVAGWIWYKTMLDEDLRDVDARTAFKKFADLTVQHAEGYGPDAVAAVQGAWETVKVYPWNPNWETRPNLIATARTSRL
jgi:hypothetical protein